MKLKYFLRPASDIPRFMRPMIVNRFLNPALKSYPWKLRRNCSSHLFKTKRIANTSAEIDRYIGRYLVFTDISVSAKTADTIGLRRC